MTNSATRRLARTLGAAVATALLLAGCGSGNSAESSPGGDAVTVETAYGELTLEKKPQRIVALYAPYVDMLSEIDVQPIAFTDGASKDEAAMLDVNPWLDGAYTGEFDRTLITAEYKVSLEEIAKHEPDLILGGTWNIDEKLYKQISKIAPTFVGVEKGNPDWDKNFRALGTLLHRTEAVDDAIDGVDAEFAEARKRLPGLQGKTYMAAAFDGERFFFGNSSWMQGIGLEPAVNQVDGQAGGNAKTDISLENIEKLNADVLTVGVWAAPDARKILEADPRFGTLPAYRNGTVMLADLRRATAGNAAGPHSLRWIIEEAVTDLEKSELNKSGR